MPSKPKTKPAAAAKTKIKPSDQQLPRWAYSTPDVVYALYAFGSDIDNHQVDFSHEVLVTRDEFVALKLHLAGMRGYSVPAEATHASH